MDITQAIPSLGVQDLLDALKESSLLSPEEMDRATKLAQEDARCDRDWPAGRLGGGATGNIRGSRADRGGGVGFAA